MYINTSEEALPARLSERRRDNPAWGLEAQGKQAGHVLSSGPQTWTSVHFPLIVWC